MNKRLKKKYNKKYHEEYLDDVALEISQSNVWRDRVFKSQYNERFLVTYEMINDIPDYLKSMFLKCKLRYYVSKVEACPEYFDNGLTIFKIEAADYKELVRYSGNNGDVI